MIVKPLLRDSAAADTDIPLAELRPRLIAAMLPHVPFDGWSATARDTGASEAGIDRDIAVMALPDAAAMVDAGHIHGTWLFILISIALLVVFGAVLEGAPALIIFGPLLTPIATQLGMNPLHYGIVLVIAMGLGLFSPPLGLGLYATCAVTGTRMAAVARPMAKYLLVLLVSLLVIAFVPALSLWLPARLGFL